MCLCHKIKELIHPELKQHKIVAWFMMSRPKICDRRTCRRKAPENVQSYVCCVYLRGPSQYTPMESDIPEVTATT